MAPWGALSVDLHHYTERKIRLLSVINASLFLTLMVFLLIVSQTPVVSSDHQYGTSANPLSFQSPVEALSVSRRLLSPPRLGPRVPHRCRLRLKAPGPGGARSTRSRLHTMLSLRSLRNPYIYGAEFSSNKPLFKKDHLSSNTFSHQDMVCSVCRSRLRTSQVIIIFLFLSA